MIKAHQIITSFLGIGFIQKGGGTVAAIIACIIWYFGVAKLEPVLIIVITIVVTIYGIWGGNKVERLWGKDSSKVVIDEVAGMMISLLFVPVTITNVLIALFLFRVFDITKPFFIRDLEKLPGGWGVMADDILAGIYANILLQAIIYLQLW